jgi:tetratricopeptide (TPR) repeat protein
LDVPIAGEAANPGGFFDGLVELEGLSLLNLSCEAPQFTVHRLVQEVTRLRQDSAQEPHELEAALAWINAVFVGDPQDVRSWPVLEPLEPHAKAVANFADRAGIAGATAELLSQVGTLLLVKADYDEAEPLLRRALQIDEDSYGQDHPAVARDLNNLAVLLQNNNRLAEAEPMYRRALQIDEASYGQNHPHVARDLNNLAGLLQTTNRLADAEPLMRRAFVIFLSSLGVDHPNSQTVLGNYGKILQAQGLSKEELKARIASLIPKD